MAQKIAISKEGNNADTSTGTALVFSSDYATHSIYNVVTSIIPAGDSFGTVSHNLGFVPKTWIFNYGTTGTETRLTRIPGNAGGPWNTSFDYSVGTSDIIIQRSGTASAGTLSVMIFTRSPNP